MKNQLYESHLDIKRQQSLQNRDTSMDQFTKNLVQNLQEKKIWMSAGKYIGTERKVQIGSLKGRNPRLDELINFWKSDAWNDQNLKKMI